MNKRFDPLRCTLDLLILNAASLGRLHGCDGNRITDSVAGTFGTTSEEV
jgi:hypothetical protein